MYSKRIVTLLPVWMKATYSIYNARNSIVDKLVSFREHIAYDELPLTVRILSTCYRYETEDHGWHDLE